MVALLPPQLAGHETSYLEAYNRIRSAHRRSPLASASSVIMLVAPNVDALCAARMLASLFKQDDIVYRIIPIDGPSGLDEAVAELRLNSDLHTLIMIELGGALQLTTEKLLESFDLKVTAHVIDSHRPLDLNNIFRRGDNGDRLLLWYDDSVEKLAEVKQAWQLLEYEATPEDADDSEEDPADGESDEDDQDERYNSDSDADSLSSKRRKHSPNSPRKRRRIDKDLRMSKEDYDIAQATINKYYTGGAWYGQSAASTIYILANLLERVDNDFLWLAILGLTWQYTTSRISRETYESYHSIYFDEVSRLNPQPAVADNVHSLASINPDDMSVRTSEELRFMLFRHWTLYDAMFHSSYIASKLGIWKEKGRKRLTGLLAKMGFSIPQTQQPYSHMDMDLKKSLVQKLNDIAPEYGLIELSYPSFLRCYGLHSQPMSAADAVDGISALIDVASGMRMEVEIEGMRNGGEWFGGGRLWDSKRAGQSEDHRHSEAGIEKPVNAVTAHDDGQEIKDGQEPDWWVKNFWTAYDALSDISLLRDSLALSMTVQRAIIRQGTSIIDKQDIRTMRNHRVVVLTQGPDLPLFSQPGVLVRLALWLVDALRDRLPGTVVGRTKKKSLPFVVACLDEPKDYYQVVGIMAALDFDQTRKNEFAYNFTAAAEHLKVGYESTWDTNVMVVERKSLNVFLDRLCG